MQINKEGFSLLELVITIIVIGILVGLSTPLFIKTKENALDKEAIANLKLLQAAQTSWNMDTGSYYVSTDITQINDDLKLAIPAGTQRNWNYATYDTGCSEATRNGGDGRTWCFSITDGTTAASDGEPHLATCGACPE